MTQSKKQDQLHTSQEYIQNKKCYEYKKGLKNKFKVLEFKNKKVKVLDFKDKN